MVEALLVLLLLAAIFVAIYLLIASTRFKHRDDFRVAGDELGLQLELGPTMGADTLRGRRGRLQVQIECGIRKNGETYEPYTGFRVSGGELPRRLSLRQENAVTSVGKLFKGEDIQLGDPRFDDRALVRGDELTAHASLDHETRQQLLPLLEENGWYEEGALRLEVTPPVTGAPELQRRLDQLVRIAEGLDTRGESAEVRLARKALKEPLPQVRALCLRRLLLGRLDPLRLETARRCLNDPNAEVATLAALALGEEGLPSLATLAHHQDLPGALRLKALKALGAGAEGALLALLEDADEALRLGVAEVLHEVGTLAAVEALQAVVHGRRTGDALRLAAARAVDAIQARHGGERGAFALAGDNDAGAVSLAEVASGAVSLTSPERS
jgi:hypothetical protein